MINLNTGKSCGIVALFFRFLPLNSLSERVRHFLPYKPFILRFRRGICMSENTLQSFTPRSQTWWCQGHRGVRQYLVAYKRVNQIKKNIHCYTQYNNKVLKRGCRTSTTGSQNIWNLRSLRRRNQWKKRPEKWEKTFRYFRFRHI